MHELLSKYFRGDISGDEKKKLFSAMENDEGLRRSFTSVQNAYGISSLLPLDTDRMGALEKLRRFKQIRNRKERYRSLRKIAGYAAVVAIAVMATCLVMRGKWDHPAHPPAGYEEFITPAGQRAIVKLHDGSTVWLNARSSLRYPNVFARGERRVELDGEAFFEVAPDPEVPFVVSTGKADIKVRGTSFNVHAYKIRDEFSLSLVEGSVEIYNKKNEKDTIHVNPYESVELAGDRFIRKSLGNMEFLLWKDGIYAFDDISFAEIIKKLELYYEVTIEVSNKMLGEYKFTGKFRQRDGVESVLRTLQKLYYFTYTKDEEYNTITIR